MKSTTTYEASGEGWPNVRTLRDALAEFPDDATLTSVELGDSQRDGAWWRVAARKTTEQ